MLSQKKTSAAKPPKSDKERSKFSGSQTLIYFHCMTVDDDNEKLMMARIRWRRIKAAVISSFLMPLFFRATQASFSLKKLLVVLLSYTLSHNYANTLGKIHFIIASRVAFALSFFLSSPLALRSTFFCTATLLSRVVIFAAACRHRLHYSLYALFFFLCTDVF